jgi:hypothetical protein
MPSYFCNGVNCVTIPTGIARIEFRRWQTDKRAAVRTPRHLKITEFFVGRRA